MIKYIINLIDSVFLRFRVLFLRIFIIRKMGRNVYILNKTSFFNGSKVTIGDNVFINVGCYFDDKDEIKIGRGTWIASFVRVITATHYIETMQEKSFPVSIGNYCWIGSNVTILPGVNIGNYAVVGAGSVVVKDIPSYSIAVGNPAKVIKKREIKLPYRVALHKQIKDFREF